MVGTLKILPTTSGRVLVYSVIPVYKTQKERFYDNKKIGKNQQKKCEEEFT